MTDETTRPVGAGGAQIKEELTQVRRDSDAKVEQFDPGAAMLGTDNEAGSAPDHDGMAEARNAPPPKSE